MTLKQIKKIRESLSRLKLFANNPDAQAIVHLDDELQNFFGKAYASPSLSSWQHIYNDIDITKQDMLYDIDNMISVLEGMLSAISYYEDVECCLDLIEEGEQSFSNTKKMAGFISKAYYAYSGMIKFDKTTEAVAVAPQEMLNISMITVSNDMVKGVITKLKTYANSLCGASKVVSSGNKQEINFQPQITLEAKNETNININFIFENARQQAEDEGLPDDQYKAVMDKLAELENISKSKESKGKRWAKAKEIMKWLVEQGIQVAGILLPVLAQTIK